MNILITFFGFGRNIFGGIERSTYNLALGLHEIGATPIVYTGPMYAGSHGSTPFPVEVGTFSGATVHDGDDAALIDALRANRGTIQADLKRLCDVHQPDYALIVDQLWGIVPIADAWDVLTCPAGVYFHVMHNSAIVDDLLKRPTAHLFSVSPHLTKTLLEAVPDLRSRRITTLPNTVVLRDFKNPQGTQRSGRTTLLHNARLVPEKGLEDVLSAFGALSSDQPPVHLVLTGGKFAFGSNEEGKQLVETFLFRHPHLQARTHLLPNVNWNDLPALIMSSDMVVLPSRAESFGLAALEAMAAGKPLVASTVGNLPHLIGDGGILVSPGDVDAITSAFRAVAADPSFAESLAARARARASQYSHLTVAAQLVESIRSA
jgi:glycosyltransferase involved in cell wall biosynthesis